VTLRIEFVAGLPRSGSTLLMNLLAQNPAFHVTPTNDLIALVAGVRGQWMNMPGFKAQGLKEVQPRVTAALRGMTYGFYERELASGRVVFDKNRGWLQHIELLEEIYGRRVNILCPVRDVRSVISSFEKLHRANPMVRRQYLGPAYAKAQTTDGRAQVLASEAGILGLPVSFIRDALNRGVGDRVILVPYRELTTHPQRMLQYLHIRLGLPPFIYDPENVEQVTQEDDAIHGWGHDLHTIRHKVEPPPDKPWEGIISPHTASWLGQRFADINQLAAQQLVAPSADDEAGQKSA
jgi:sulfotransferase